MYFMTQLLRTKPGRENKRDAVVSALRCSSTTRKGRRLMPAFRRDKQIFGKVVVMSAHDCYTW